MTQATAIVLSANPVMARWNVWHTLGHVRRFQTLEELHAERLAALEQVTTEFCAYVDDDDELPENTGDQITQIMGMMQEQHSNLTYTDWTQREPDKTFVRSPGAYSHTRHVTCPTWMHALVVMRTEAAQAIAKTLPLGIYWTEFLLHVQLAKTNPIHYPHVGYIWNKKDVGMHRHPKITEAQMNSVRWYLSKGTQ
jgi:hypothetical protein